MNETEWAELRALTETTMASDGLVMGDVLLIFGLGLKVLRATRNVGARFPHDAQEQFEPYVVQQNLNRITEERI